MNSPAGVVYNNAAMPNAHTHLAAAIDLLQTAAFGQAVPWLAGDPAAGSSAAQAAFLLGTISPDARAIGGQRREATHFFTIPPADSRPAYEVMLAAWPGLHASRLDDQRAAFVAGYIAHLVMDQVWLERIVMPGLFIPGRRWGIHHPRWRLYSILMTYIEYRAAARVPPALAARLGSAAPSGGWLPFVKDRHLIAWRDHVAHMIRTDGPRRTSRLFARSNGMSPAALEAIVLSEARMAEEAYRVVTPEQLQGFEEETARLTGEAVQGYLTAR